MFSTRQDADLRRACVGFVKFIESASAEAVEFAQELEREGVTDERARAWSEQTDVLRRHIRHLRQRVVECPDARPDTVEAAERNIKMLAEIVDQRREFGGRLARNVPGRTLEPDGHVERAGRRRRRARRR